MSISAMKEMANYIDALGGDSKKYRQAIEQAEKQEPVAWIEHHKGGDNLEWENPGGKCTPLYTTPPAAPMQEPVAEARFDGTLHWREPYGIGLHRIQGPLYTTPQQRTWVGLTAEEREQVQAESYGKVPHHVALIAAVEAKLKEKNT